MKEEKEKLVKEYEEIELEILRLQQKLKRLSYEIDEVDNSIHIKVAGFNR